MRRHWALGVLVACGGAGADIEGDDTDGGGTFATPDVAGAYDVVLSAIEGCEGLAAPVDALQGPLTITQDGDALTLQYAEVAVAGSIDPSFTWEIADSVVVDGWTLDVSGR